MRILGVDSASSCASAAVIEEGRVLGETMHRPNGCLTARNHQAENLLPLIDAALRASAVTLPDIDGYAVTIGPGSFTGLRVGLSTIKGLAYGSDIPIAGVSTLHAMAARRIDCAGIVCPVLDARKNELYAALFRSDGLALERLCDDALLSCEHLAGLARDADPLAPFWVIGDGVAVYGERLIASIGPRARIANGDSRSTIAASVARLGEVDLTRGKALSQPLLKPRYLSPARVELSSEKSV